MSLRPKSLSPLARKKHADLVQQMRAEVHLMREILGNLFEEQEAHLRCARQALIPIMQQRESLFKQLSITRQSRIDALKHLAASVSQDGKSDDEGLSILRDTHPEEVCELLTLRDQIVALIEKTNTQHSVNKDLSAHPLGQPDMPKPKKSLKKKNLPLVLDNEGPIDP